MQAEGERIETGVSFVISKSNVSILLSGPFKSDSAQRMNFISLLLSLLPTPPSTRVTQGSHTTSPTSACASSRLLAAGHLSY